MKRNPALPFSFAILVFVWSCHGKNAGEAGQKIDSPTHRFYPHDSISAFRKEIKPGPVAEYREKTDDPLNNWYFSVRLYETPKTFQYLLRMQFEEVRGLDTLELPNFGTEPRPILQKGKDRYSCIIGFLDNENKFREYKLVYVRGGNDLKLTTLNHYSVVATER